MRLTQEEFDIMVRELLNGNPPSYNMLCRITEKLLRTKVTAWCDSDMDLRGGQHGDDVMQLVHLQLIKKTVPYFLLREGIEGEYNNDPEGFEAWGTTVAKNQKRDYADKIRRGVLVTDSLDKDPATEDVPEDDTAERRSACRNILLKAFSLVLDSDMNVYKKLTWLAVSLVMIRKNVTKIKATHMVVNVFKNKTLNHMYDVVQDAMGYIGWLDLTYHQHKKIVAALQRESANGVPMGECLYKDFFMGKKENMTDIEITEAGLKSVSDWMNRINYNLYRVIKGKTPPRKKGVAKPEKQQDKKASSMTTEEKPAAAGAADGPSSETDKKRSGENETRSC